MFDLDPALLSSELRRRAWLHARDEARAAYAAYRAAEEREAAAAAVLGAA